MVYPIVDMLSYVARGIYALGRDYVYTSGDLSAGDETAFNTIVWGDTEPQPDWTFMMNIYATYVAVRRNESIAANWYDVKADAEASAAAIDGLAKEDLTAVVGQIKTVRHQSPADHGRWMLCDSRVLTQATYPDLFAALDIYYNAGVMGINDLTEFALPFDNANSADHYHDFIFTDAV